MRRKKLIQYAAIIILLALAMLTRFLPHPPNVTAVAAAGFFAAAVFPKRWGVILPLAAMVLSDFAIGFHNLILFTWGSMAIHGMIGWWARRKQTGSRILLGSLAGSLQFYLITNWAVWQFGTMYPPDLSGLAASYVAAIPFFRNSLLGDLFYTGALFILYEFVRVFVLKSRLAEPQAVPPVRSD